MQQTDRAGMGTEPLQQLIWRLASPSILAQIINILYNIVDRIYVGHLPEVGAYALTGLGVSMPLVIIVSAFSAFANGGGAPLAAIEMGRDKKEGAERYLGNSLAMLLSMTVVLTAVGLFFKEPILLAFGASSKTLPFALAYTGTYLWGTGFVLLALGLNSFIVCQGEAKTAMYSVLIGAVSNIILDPIFIFGFKMGVQGAAVATIISQAFSAIWVLGFLGSKRSSIRIRWSLIRLELDRVWKIISLGVSTFIMRATESAVAVVFNNSLLHYGGDLYVGTMTIMQSVMMLIAIPVSGYSQGVQPIISFNYGAKKLDRMREAVHISLRFMTGATLLYYLLVFFAPGLFGRMFTTHPDLLGYVRHYLPIFMGGLSLFGIQMTAQMYFVGTNQAGKSLFLAVLRKIILLIPLALLLPLRFGVDGVIWAEPLADGLSIVVSGLLLVKSLRALKRMS